MNRSFSKIRHIQESNQRLQKRLLNEIEVDDLRDDKLQQIIDMDRELDNDPTYKKYEKMYTKNKIKKMISSQMGLDLDFMSEKELEGLLGMFTSMVDISKNDKGGIINKMDRESLLAKKDGLIDIVNNIIEMAVEDDEFELASKLRDYNKLVQSYN